MPDGRSAVDPNDLDMQVTQHMLVSYPFFRFFYDSVECSHEFCFGK